MSVRARGRGGRSGSGLKLPAGLWLALGLAVLTGCYRYLPPQVAPEPGDRVRIELNDQGRVQLANAIGPEIGRIEGVLDSESDSAVVLRVAQVWGEYGGLTKWEGERVSFSKAYIRDMRERKLSTARTVVAVAALTVGVVTFVLTRNLLGFGETSSGPNPGGGGGGSGGSQ